MTSGSNDNFYFEDENQQINEYVEEDYGGPRKIHPEQYMESRSPSMFHTAWIPMCYRVDVSAPKKKAA